MNISKRDGVLCLSLLGGTAFLLAQTHTMRILEKQVGTGLCGRTKPFLSCSQSVLPHHISVHPSSSFHLCPLPCRSPHCTKLCSERLDMKTELPDSDCCDSLILHQKHTFDFQFSNNFIIVELIKNINKKKGRFVKIACKIQNLKEQKRRNQKMFVV